MVEEVVDLTTKMMRFQSTNDNEGAIKENLEFIKDYFSDSGFNIKEYSFEETHSIVITYSGNSNDPKLMLHGHIDVVEGEEELFEPRVKNSKIFGRGSADMKAGVACLMKIMNDLKDQSPDIGLMIVSDEEVGGFNGAKKLFEEECSPKFAISAEPNNIEGYMDIITHQKGILQIKIEAEGKTAHGSRPWNGENAAEKLWNKYQNEVQTLFESNDGSKWTTTLNLGKFESGNSTNKVPGEAEAYLDVRTSTEYPNSEVREDIENISDIETEFILDEPGLETSNDNRFVLALKSSAEEVYGSCELARKEPGSDMRHLTRQNIPAVVYGPEGYKPHGPGEYAVIESFEDYISALKNFAKNNF